MYIYMYTYTNIYIYIYIYNVGARAGGCRAAWRGRSAGSSPAAQYYNVGQCGPITSIRQMLVILVTISNYK